MNLLDKLYTSKEASYFESVRFEIASLLPKKIDRVLEVGCGSGATLNWLKKEKGCKWAGGVELNQGAAHKAKERLDFFVDGDIENIQLSINNDSIDLILCLDVLEHLIDPWLTLRRLSKFLKPGGVIISSVPNLLHKDVIGPLILRGRFDYVDSGILDKTHLRFFTKNTAIELMESSGLSISDIKSIIPNGLHSKSGYLNMLTLRLFEKFIVTQYIIKGIKE